VVTVRDLEDSLSRLEKLITDQNRSERDERAGLDGHAGRPD